MPPLPLTPEQKRTAHMLRQLRNGSVVKDACDDVWQKADGLWYGIGYKYGYSSDTIARCHPVHIMEVAPSV